MNYKLIALDLDGTTIDRRLMISDENKKAIDLAINQGIIVAVITGKMFAASLPIVQKFKGAAYLFASNGANVYDIHAQEHLASYPLSIEQVMYAIQVIEKFGALYRIYSCDAMFSPQESHLVDSIRRDYPNLPVFIGSIPEDEIYYKIYVQDSDEKLSAIIDTLKFANLQVHPSDNHNIEITSTQANKGEALRFLKSYLGIPTEAVIAIGNHDNDLPMFAEAGYSVAVKNAPLYVQKKADMVTKHCEEDGVAHAIYHLFPRLGLNRQK